MKNTLLLISGLFIGLLSGVNAQIDTSLLRYGNLISEDSLRKHLMVIASDEFEGRDTGKPGQKKAAQYLAKHFERWGLEQVADSGYFQRFYVGQNRIDTALIQMDEEKFLMIEDFYFFNPLAAEGTRSFNELRFLGYGIDDSLYSDYKGVKDNIENIVIWEEEPIDDEENYLLSGNGFNSEWSRDFSLKLQTARDKGVKNLFIVNDDYETVIGRLSGYLKMARTTLWEGEKEEPEMSVFYISPETASKMLGKKYKPFKISEKIARKGESETFSVSANFRIEVEKVQNKLSTENVLGYIEGSERPGELLVVTSHYDHLGMRDGEIYNGADDDGSGTVALMEIARVMSKMNSEGITPRRSVLFMAVSGEEKGLLGSLFYTNNPVFPLDSTVANLNIDMIGRNDEDHEPNSEYIYVIGSDRLSTTLHKISEKTNDDCCNIELDYTYNDPNDPNRFYYRSDHYNFVKNNIPAIFYFSGVHEDYHKPTDTPDKIQYKKLASIVKLVFHTAWNVSNTEQRIEVDVEPANQ